MVDFNEFQLTVTTNLIYMKKFYIFFFLIFAFSANSMEKKTTFDKKLFDTAQLNGKVVVVSSWTKYCSSCASQMKVLDKAKNDFDNIEIFSFNITNKEIAKLFDEAQLDGKVVVVSSWTKYCSSCASQMKVLDKAKNEFDNIEFFSFNIKNKEIAKLFDVQYQTTLLIFKDNKEIYRSIGETSKDLIYEATQSSI